MLDEKREAIRLAVEVGPNEASRRLNLPSGTVACWCFKARQAEAAGGAWPARVAPRDEDETLVPASADDGDSRSEEEPRRVAKVYAPSQRAQALERAAEVGITATSRELGTSRFSLYSWRQRVRLAAEGQGESPTSGPDPSDIAAQRDHEILTTWREHPDLGPSQVRNQLRRRGIKVSPATVRRVMEDAGYRPPKARQPNTHDTRYEAVRPNHLWHSQTPSRSSRLSSATSWRSHRSPCRRASRRWPRARA